MDFVKGRSLFGSGPSKEIPCLTGEGAPTTATEGAVGSLYIDTSSHATLYKCIKVAESVYTWAPVLDEDEIMRVVGEVLSLHEFDYISLKGNAESSSGAGIYMESDGEEAAPVLALYGQNADEGVIVRGVAEPTLNTDAANKAYVDKKIEEGPGPNGNGGLSAAAAELLVDLLRNALYPDNYDTAGKIAELEVALGTGGDSGDEETPDTGGADVTQSGSTLTISGVQDITTITQSGSVLVLS